MNTAEPSGRTQAGLENTPVSPALQEVLTGEMAQRYGLSRTRVREIQEALDARQASRKEGAV